MSIAQTPEDRKRIAAGKLTSLEYSASQTFGTYNVDTFYQEQAPRLWSMIERTNRLMENQSAKTEEILAAMHQTNAAVAQFLQQAQQMQGAEYWKGKYEENDSAFKELYKYCDRIGNALAKTNQRLQSIETKIDGKIR